MSSTALSKGYDPDYYSSACGTGYYFGGREPAGRWIGAGLPALGLQRGQEVDAKVMRDLYLFDIKPDGEPLTRRQRKCQYDQRKLRERVEAEIEKKIAALGRFVTDDEKRKIAFDEFKKMRTNVALYDFTHGAEKSVGMAFAGFLALARKLREAGDEAGAEQAMKRARSVEGAVVAGADELFGYIEREAAYIRTGHHSVIKDDNKTIRTGEWRDALGLVAAQLLQHTNRENEPSLHVHMPILNRAQRLDQEDDTWRALDGQAFWRMRLAAGARATLRQAQELARLGFALVKREDGAGYEIAGVTQATMDAFSTRAMQVKKELARKLEAFEKDYGRPPRMAEMRRLGDEAARQTRKPKSKPKDGDEEAELAEVLLAQWQQKATDTHTQQLDLLPGAITQAAVKQMPVLLPLQAERDQMIRAAVAEVQRHHAHWTRGHLDHELQKQIPVLPAHGVDWPAFLDALGDRAMSGQVPDLNIIRIAPVPDLVDVAPLGLRKDGTSVHRHPGEAKYALASHLDLEADILKSAEVKVDQLVSENNALDLLKGSGLNPDQLRAVVGMLASDRFMEAFVAPAGSGKTTAMRAFGQAWTRRTGCRVIGLTTSENASRVLAGKGMTETWNIARFFARHVRVYEGDVIVIDESSQLSTTDLARIRDVAELSGARIKLVGDTAQLPSVDAGGMFSLIAHDYGNWRLQEILRMKAQWERDASIRIHDGDETAWLEYKMRGRIHDGAEDVMRDEAVTYWVADYARGRNSLLISASSEEAAVLSRLARERLAERGLLNRSDDIVLRDGNEAGTGDLVRARLNTWIQAGNGQKLSNRDTLRITGWQGTGSNRSAVTVRRLEDGTWTRPFLVKADYLQENAELDYAGNSHVAQGRTVDGTQSVLREGMLAAQAYVMTTRGTDENHLFVVTGPADPHAPSRREREYEERQRVTEAVQVLEQSGPEAAAQAGAEPEEEPDRLERSSWQSVLSSIMHNDDTTQTATEALREAQEFPVHTRHLVELREAFWRKDVVPQIDAMVEARLDPAEYQRYRFDPERTVLLEQLRAREIAGQRISENVEQITADPLGGSRSIAAVLYGRLGKLDAPEWGTTTEWTQRNPAENTTPVIEETGTALAARQAELGRQMAEKPPAWALEAWGMSALQGSVAERADWEQKAGIVASYRELAGVTAPDHALGDMPNDHAERREAWHAAMRALALPDEQALLRAMGRGELEATVLAGERVLAAAKPDVSAELSATSSARIASEHQAEAARLAADKTIETSAAALATLLTDVEADLNVKQAARAEWEEMHAPALHAAREAEAELKRRGYTDDPKPEAEPEAEAETPEVIPVTDAEVAAAAAELRPEPAIDPAEAAAVKAEQTARVEAERQARAEASARACPVTDAEIAQYGQPEPETETAPEPKVDAEAVLAEVDANIESAERSVEILEQAEAERAAKVEQAAINEPVTEPEPEIDLGGELEIEAPEIAWEAPSPSVAHEPDPEPVRVDDDA